MSEHPLQPQWDWLERLPAGSRLVRGDKTEWLKIDMGAVVHHRGGNDYWANLSNGETIHFSFLADEEKPPRLYTKPSPFA